MSPDALAQEFASTLYLPWQFMLARVLGATILTGLIGLEREARGRPAGLRTHMLVGLAASAYCITTLELIAMDYGTEVKLDPLRLVEAVTAGVAFLAAGMIVFSKGEVKGLTTGASLWLAAAVGVAVGMGFWPLAAMVTLAALTIIRAIGLLEGRAEGD
ncbi:putative Mg2+ transporter-C (MgtC) family protein [Cribrihabitans marinus]|uniref:Protein MgtC n=1 Tax=Cribrihabitans marinus TaxID=1227549 RepID=A0A1H7BF78_9RHOB|nr:MgtC/SapB family protein [Cribrihabitans marinus]GGH34640.1 membrane protein [Cribrihabitans marinus]SEJ76311.1 putative Mg2+ transporter-C (MgtC) family protein [Cribrihabitans marinus]